MTDDAIFAAALEQPGPVERAAYLDTVCSPDTAQRKRIDALLAAHDKAGAFLERPAVAPPNPSTAPTRAFRDSAKADDTATRTHGGLSEDDEDDALGFLAPGTRPDSLGRIGHYEILEVLGHGGFGIVYRAFDEVLQRVVAVKVLAPSLATTSPARKRFLREAQSAAPIRHENVVRIHEIGEQPLPHLVMEFIPGETLQHKLDRTGPLDIAEIVRVGRQVAEGLSAAHANGLIHRDIKPSNILIDSGPEARVKITDFGLARAADDASLTRSGTVAGTPMYMAPEQAKGESLDHRVDLFSLGSVLYVMCSGRPPFRASTTLAVLKRVAEEDPRPIREIIPEVPVWLCRIVEKLHAKDPAERFQTAREVADVLADCEKQLAAHKEVKDTSRIPEGKARAVCRSGDLTWQGIVVGLVSLFVLWAWLGQFAYLYATDQGKVRFSDETDPDLQQLLVRRDGEVVATLDRANSQAKLPPGDYEVEAVCIAGYEATKFTAETRRTMTVRSTFERVEGRPVIRLTLHRGDATTVAATAERRAAAPQSPPAANGSEVKDWGTAVDPDRDCQFEADADGLTITVPGGKHNLNPTPAFNNLTAPRVLRNAEGDFQLETRVESFPPPGGSQYDYVGAGLLLWQDARNFVRFTRSARGESKQPYIHFECFRDGGQTLSTGLDLTNKPIMLRAARTGGVFRFHWSADGTTWNEYRVESPIRLADKLAVGICAINTTPIPLVAKFSQSQFQPGTDVWVSLFNGKDLTGWTPSPHSPGQWRVEGGELVGKQGPGYLFAAKSYVNFHLRAEVQINATGNSGISFRQQFQAEIRDDPPCPTGSLLEVTPAKTKTLARYPKSTPTDTWFTLEVRAEGAILTSRINDGPWVAAQDTRPPGSRAGPLQLEVFDPNTVVRFRKIEIQEISTNPATAQGREDLAKLNGEWVVRQARVDQSPLLGSDLVEKKLSLHNGKFVLPIRDDSGYPWALTGTYDLDETKKQLVFRFKDQDFPVPCTYRVEGEKLILDFPEPRIGKGDTGSTEPFVPDVRLETQQNLKTMGIAIHNFVAKNNDTFPPAAIVKDGKPLLSWRVVLLPHLGQDELYRQFKLNEPWDSEHNKTLIAKMPLVYSIPGITTPPGQTHYRVFVGPGTAFEPLPERTKGIRFTDFMDGLADTILVAEAAESVIWTKPDDLPYDPKAPLPKLGVFAIGPHMVMGDGSVIRPSPQATEKGIRGAIVRNEGDVLSPQMLYRIPMRGPALHLEFERSAAPLDREELKKLQGEWIVSVAEMDGAPLPPDYVRGLDVKLTERTFELRTKGYAIKDFSGTLGVDAAKKQLLLDTLDQKGLVRAGYRIDGDRLRLNFAGQLDIDGRKPSPQRLQERASSANNLSILSIGMLNYAAARGSLPPAALPTPNVKDGKPLLSWRVAILPYMDHDALYKEFKLDEPWDSEHNKRLIAKMPKVFEAPGIKTPESGMTHYRGFVGSGSVFEPRPNRDRGFALNEILDGTAGTIMLVEAADPVIWTKPDDLPFDPKKPLPKLGVYERAVNVAYCDGKVVALSRDVTDDVLRGIITRNGGEAVSAPVFSPEPPQSQPLYLELRRRGSLPAGAVLLKALDPAKDKASPFGANMNVRVEDGAWRIEDTLRPGDNGNVLVALGGTITEDIPTDGVIIYRAKVKLLPKGKDTRGDLLLNTTTPSYHKYDWPEHLGEFHGELSEWTEKEVRYPAEVFHKKNPPTISMQIRLVGNGVLWIKDVELIHIPAAKQSAPKPAPKKPDPARPVLLKVFDPAKDKPVPLRGDASKIVRVENGAWRIENDKQMGNFRVALGTITDGIPDDGILVCRCKVKLQPKHKDAWGDLELNAASPSFHGYDWPGHLSDYRGEITEWAEKEVRYPVEVIRKKNPPTITVHVGLHADGVLWVKDVELLHIPAPLKPPAIPKPPTPPLAVYPFDGTKAKEYQDAWAAHLVVPVEVENSVGMKLRLIPPGKFLMGSIQKEIDDLLVEARETEKFLVHAEGPRREVQLTSPFYMGRYEVTQTEYFRVMGVNPSDFALTGKSAPKVKGIDTDRFPVEMVTWDEAEAFCRKLSARPEEVAAGRSYRLPTEAEWEYACRAGTESPFHTGEWLAGTQANIHLAIGRPQSVGGFPANAFGLHDMHGNVFEWCRDWFAESYRDLPAVNPQGPNAGDARIVRGGNYGYKDRYCRSAARDRFQPIARRGGIGFRVVVVIAQKPQVPAKGLDPAVLQPLKDVVAAKMQVRDLTKVRFDVGIAGRIELLQAEAGLIESRIKLAEAEGSSAVVVTLLEDMVKFRQEERDLIAIRVEAGADRRDVLSEADVRLAQAQARLAKAKPKPEIAPEPRRKP